MMSGAAVADLRVGKGRQRVADASRCGPTAVYGLQFLCAWAVMANHWSGVWFDRFMPQAQIPVDFFFALEGALAARLLGSGRDGLDCFVRRFRDVFPLYLLGLAFGAVVILPEALGHRDGWSPWLLAQAVGRGALLQPARLGVTERAAYPLNSPSWAIVLELVAFAGFAGLGRRLRRRLSLPVAMIGALGIIAPALLWHDLNVGWRAEHYAFGFARIAYDFFIGACIYRWVSRHAHRVPRVHPALVWAAFVSALFLNVRFVGLPLIFIALPALVALALKASEPAKLAGVGRLAHRYTLAFYLLHFPLLLLLERSYLSAGLPIWFRISAAYLALTTACVAGLAVLAMGGISRCAAMMHPRGD